MKYLASILVLCLLACSASQTPPVSRVMCYAAADVRAQARVDAECRIGDAGVSFDECPARDEILADLRKSQEACP